MLTWPPAPEQIVLGKELLEMINKVRPLEELSDWLPAVNDRQQLLIIAARCLKTILEKKL